MLYKKIGLFFALSYFFIAQAQQYQITGTVSGLQDSSLVFLLNQQGSAVSQAVVMKEQFVLTGTVAAPDIYQLRFSKQKEAMVLFMGNENIVVSGSAAKLALLQITGGSYQSDFEARMQQISPLKNKLDSLALSIRKTPPSSQAQEDSVMRIFAAFKASAIKSADAFIRQKPESPVAAFLLYIINPLFENSDELTTRYKLLQGEATKTVYAQLIARSLSTTMDAGVGAVGSIAPDFTQTTPDGKQVSLSSFKGKYVLIDFWASWCGPCRRENPSVVKAYNTYKDKGFTILGVSLDQSKSNWVQAIIADNLSWTQVSDLKSWNNEAAQLYKVESIPQNFLLDPKGVIIAKNLRGELLLAKLQEILDIQRADLPMLGSTPL